MIYEYKVKRVNGEEVSLDAYKGKVLLVVNTATGCGFTPQYEELQKLYNKYKEEGFEILDFPSNQFWNQAPGTNEEIVEFCQLKYNTTFETFAKIDVNGKNVDPVYEFLKQEAPAAEEDEASIGLYSFLQEKGFVTNGNDIKWNFTKFLIDREGNVIGRFAPTFSPLQLEEKIKELLSK